MKKCIILSLLFLMASCAMPELTADPGQDGTGQESAGMLMTRSVAAQMDSLSLLSNFQSDVELMLLNQIHYKNGVLVLELSREDAVDLGIPEELYDRCSDELKRINDAQ